VPGNEHCSCEQCRVNPLGCAQMMIMMIAKEILLLELRRKEANKKLGGPFFLSLGSSGQK